MSFCTRKQIANTQIAFDFLPEYYDAVEKGVKTWEYRFNDRNYTVGDVLILHENTQIAFDFFDDVKIARGRFDILRNSANVYVTLQDRGNFRGVNTTRHRLKVFAYGNPRPTAADALKNYSFLEVAIMPRIQFTNNEYRRKRGAHRKNEYSDYVNRGKYFFQHLILPP